MSAQDVYLHLWSIRDDKELENIVRDSSISPLLRIWALLKLGRRKEAKALFDKTRPSTNNEFDDMLYQELELFFDLPYLKPPELRKRLSAIVKIFPLSIWSKIMLASMLGKGQYRYARELYVSVMEICPSNLYALAGYIKASLYLQEKDEALSFLDQVLPQHLLAGFSIGRRIYWSVVFTAYKIASGKWGTLRLLIGLSFFLLGFFPQTVWLLLGIVIFALLLALYYFLGKDELVATIIFLFAISIVFAWLIGRGILFLENK